jgi:hypothetical protein
MYGEVLEWVSEFKYPGCLLTWCKDNDTQAMEGNLKKAHQCWARLSCVLRAEKAAAPRVCRIFYMAKVMLVLYCLVVRHMESCTGAIKRTRYGFLK